MAVQQINVTNFTVFKNLSFESDYNLNVIIGDNSTGKTHLLKLIYAHWLQQDDKPFSLDKVFSTHGFADSNIQQIIKLQSTSPFTPVFIPAKEMLSMSNITRIDDKYSRELSIDRTLIDIIKKAQHIKPNVPPGLAERVVNKLENIIGGKVFLKEDNSFWIKKNDGLEIPFSMEAEGFRKIGLLWQLIMNESIVPGTVLLWDEPEANINPRVIPVLVEIILELARNGVQMFIATHDYFLAKYIEVLMSADDSVIFHSFFKTGDGIDCESSGKFSSLVHNEIITEKIRLYEAEIEKVTE